jgi:hypothetical protein
LTRTCSLDRTAPILPLLPGVPQRQTHDYTRTRHGTTNLYAALDVASGKVISQLTLATAPPSSSGSWRTWIALCQRSWSCI